MLLVYENNIIVAGDNKEEKLKLRRKLLKEFKIKELGRLKYFLGIEVAYLALSIFISQKKNVIDLWMEIGKNRCKLATMPMDPHKKLGESKEEPLR